MSVNVDWVIRQMNEWAPERSAMAWDNVGLLIGDRGQEAAKILIALDCTDAVAAEAAEMGASLVITHHPLIFAPLKTITADTSLGRRILTLIQNNIAVYSAHTNLDMAEGGVNDALFEKLGLSEKENLLPPDSDEAGLGRTGRLARPMPIEAFAAQAGARLGLTAVRFVSNRSDGSQTVRKAGLCSGAGARETYFRAAKEKGCDVYVTGDIRFHEAQAALEMDLCLVDVTHYAGEAIITEKIRAYLQARAVDAGVDLEMAVSRTDGQVFRTIPAKGGQ
ncbi:MAG: Nif3-like dinuclear metal center hexameric protein [Clostridiales bacterium]|jgi:dinuclear metal center YbgI/SA1388 family protein|nr:Nif3-like dinuclear metal center hexameric protein [Clostridiales bacterium]